MTRLIPFNKRGSLLNKDFADFYNMLDDFFTDGWPYGRSLEKDTFKVDVQENEKEYLIDADLPGILKDEINVELNEGKLTISVQREENIDEEKKNYIHKERRYSSMSRSIYLTDAKVDGIKAKLDNGVLNIVVPKVEQVDQSIKIDID